MSEEDQIMRLICTGVAFFGLLAHGGAPATAGGQLALCDMALKTGQVMFETATKKGIWPLKKDENA